MAEGTVAGAICWELTPMPSLRPVTGFLPYDFGDER